MELPWSDLRVSFDIHGDSEKLSQCFRTEIIKRSLPYGWEFIKIDSYQDKTVALFRINKCVPSKKKGMHVLNILRQVENLAF